VFSFFFHLLLCYKQDPDPDPDLDPDLDPDPV